VPGHLTVASFNVHGGVDGWGRPFDVVAACRRLDADVIVLEEVWSPDQGQAVVAQVGADLGYRVTSVPMARARMFPVPRAAGHRWGPVLRTRPGVGMRVVPGRRGTEPGTGPTAAAGALGTVGIALLARPGCAPAEVIELGQQGGDSVRRFALQASVPVDGSSLIVTGTHMPHLRHGSPRRLRLLAGRLPRPETPAVLMGDMNLWGPPLTALLPGWSRAVRGRTWPSWRPLFQIDHVLVTTPVRVLHSEVVDVPGSDHLPIRATLSVR
jgi:endonuclease/exonuclease/phosphatase family metal-dependent hydrolase